MKRLMILLVVLVTLVPAVPAFAEVYEEGSINCGGNYVAVRSYGVGTVRHYAPSSTQIGSWANSDWTVRVSSTFLSNTSWKVTSQGSLDGAGTYAYCWGN